MNKICWRDKEADITLRQVGVDRFTVIYGKQIDKDLNYAEAAEMLGEVIMHALSCQGLLDNREKGEKIEDFTEDELRKMGKKP